ncbi:hypothetical protein T03_824 [Trichinella britovi]|uniref:Uncharacterized protein n=1 Tax=Trichinella britovi TaxID=45882 RepID=A0A0V1C8S3_TRIBR|nr:hypothetical protein T03_824 [Trichinella britovi]
MHRWEDSGKSKQWKSPCRRCPPGICKDDGEVRGFPVLRRKEVPRRPPVQRGTILQSSSRTYTGSGHLSDARRGVTRTVLITHGWAETAPKYQPPMQAWYLPHDTVYRGECEGRKCFVEFGDSARYGRTSLNVLQ